MFKLQPYWGFLITAFFILVGGGLLTGYLFAEDRSGMENHQWLFVLFGTLLLALGLVIVAFSRYRFEHLHHHRPKYKRG